jgi:hypothetical protein
MNEFFFGRLAEAVDHYRREYQRHEKVKVIAQWALAILSTIHKRIWSVRSLG